MELLPQQFVDVLQVFVVNVLDPSATLSFSMTIPFTNDDSTFPQSVLLDNFQKTSHICYRGNESKGYDLLRYLTLGDEHSLWKDVRLTPKGSLSLGEEVFRQSMQKTSTVQRLDIHQNVATLYSRVLIIDDK